MCVLVVYITHCECSEHVLHLLYKFGDDQTMKVMHGDSCLGTFGN